MSMVLRKKVFFDRQYLVKMKIVIAEIKKKLLYNLLIIKSIEINKIKSASWWQVTSSWPSCHAATYIQKNGYIIFTKVVGKGKIISSIEYFPEKKSILVAAWQLGHDEVTCHHEADLILHKKRLTAITKFKKTYLKNSLI
jgi:hypothetical protein